MEAGKGRWLVEPVTACVDGGGEGGDVVLAAIEGFMADLAPGQILQVISQHPDASVDIPLWCDAAGHAVVRIEHDRDVSIWIRKGL